MTGSSVNSLTSAFASFVASSPPRGSQSNTHSRPLTHEPCSECHSALPSEWGNPSKMAFYCSKLVEDQDDRREKISFWSESLIALTNHTSHQQSLHSKLSFTVKELQSACRYDGDEPTLETLLATVSSLVQSGVFATADFADIIKVRASRTSSVPTKSERSSFSFSTFASPSKLISVTAQVAWSASKSVARSAGETVARSLWSTPTAHQSINIRYVNMNALRSLSKHITEQVRHRDGTLGSSVVRLDELVKMTSDLTEDDRRILLVYMSSKSWLVEILSPEADNQSINQSIIPHKSRVFKIDENLSSVEPLEYDRTIISHVLELTESRIADAHKQMEQCVKKAKHELKPGGNREVAKLALARKKRFESTSKTLESQAFNLHHIIDAMDQAHEQQQMVSCMASAQRALTSFQKLTRVEDVEELMDQLKETTDDINEINQLLSEPVADVDVDDEMEQMMRDLESNNPPTSQAVVTTVASPSQATRPSQTAALTSPSRIAASSNTTSVSSPARVASTISSSSSPAATIAKPSGTRPREIVQL